VWCWIDAEGLPQLLHAARRWRALLRKLWAARRLIDEFPNRVIDRQTCMVNLTKKSRGLYILATMRTFLLTLLLAILPLQFAWGAASGYCMHETEAGAAHFGHHEHQLSASSGEKSRAAKLKTIADGDDCIGCHINVIHVAPVATPLVLAAVGQWPPAFRAPTYRPPIPIGLERPARQLVL
jgi:hypothetical protein